MALLGFIYGTFAYLCAFAVFGYAVGFIGGFAVPGGIDAEPRLAALPAAAIDLVLVTLFALQHSVMARAGFKARLARLLPAAFERSTYVLASALFYALLFWQWQPIAGTVWRAEGAARIALCALYALGWLIAIASTFMISHFELFGLRQVWLNLRGRPQAALPFVKVALYRFVRHPIMLGFLVAFWSAPAMSLGHLLFSAASTVYIFIGTWFEERDLRRSHGALYEAYAREAGMLLPRRKSPEP